MSGMIINSNKMPGRTVIFPRDIQNITGVKDRTARLILQRVRLVYNKSKHEFVTIAEFAAATGIDEMTIREYIK